MSNLINIVKDGEDKVIVRTRDGVTKPFDSLSLTNNQLEELVFELAQWYKLKRSRAEPVTYAHLWLNSTARK